MVTRGNDGLQSRDKGDTTLDFGALRPPHWRVPRPSARVKVCDDNSLLTRNGQHFAALYNSPARYCATRSRSSRRCSSVCSCSRSTSVSPESSRLPVSSVLLAASVRRVGSVVRNVGQPATFEQSYEFVVLHSSPHLAESMVEKTLRIVR